MFRFGYMKTELTVRGWENVQRLLRLYHQLHSLDVKRSFSLITRTRGMNPRALLSPILTLMKARGKRNLSVIGIRIWTRLLRCCM